jgi:hypothetical protein
MSTIKATQTMNRPLQNQLPRNRLLVWIGRVLIGLLVTLAALAMIGAIDQAVATVRDTRALPHCHGQTFC